MPRFNSVDFGRNIRRIRKSRGLSQENLGYAIGKDKSTIARYENGSLSPNAKEIAKICEALKVEEYQLFNSHKKLLKLEENKNPFDTETLYLYYNTRFSDNTFKPCGFVLKLYEQNGNCKVEMRDFKNGTIYMEGYLVNDDNVVFIILENYKPLYPRLEIAELTINISNGTNSYMIGSYMGTDKRYTPTLRKCVVSKEIIPDDKEKEVAELLKIDDEDKKSLKDNNVLYLHSSIKSEFEK